jgi:cytoskeletal protein RodZ
MTSLTEVGFGVPNDASSLYVPSTSQTISGAGIFRNDLVSSTAPYINVIANNSGGTINFSGSTNLSSSGNITVATNTTVNSTNTNLTGTTSQAVALTAASSSLNVTNFTLNNSAGSILSGSGFVNVTGTATVSAGLLTAGGRLVLKSTMSGTARIAAVAGTLTGNVTTETFIPGGRRAYRF